MGGGSAGQMDLLPERAQRGVAVVVQPATSNIGSWCYSAIVQYEYCICFFVICFYVLRTSTISTTHGTSTQCTLLFVFLICHALTRVHTNYILSEKIYSRFDYLKDQNIYLYAKLISNPP